MTRRRSKLKIPGNGGEVDKADESPPAKIPRTDEIMEVAARDTMCVREQKAASVDAMLDSTKIILIKGPIGSGKTHCALEVARRRGDSVHVIQLSDQYDAKMLFGTYNCTDVPGEFVWVPSELSKRLKTSCLILLEDIDTADPGVVASLMDLAERRDYPLPNGNRERINKNCRMVATVSANNSGASGVRTSLIRDYPYTIEMEPFSNEEIGALALLQYPSLARADQKMIEIFTRLNEMIANFASKSSIERRLNIRDFLRACGRVVPLMSAESVKLFHELHDVWVAHLSREDFRRSAAKLLAQHLNLAEARVDSIFDEYKPEVETAQATLKIGRSTLRRSLPTQEVPVATHPFALTRACCQLMERIAVCIANKEPVLLVGETGVGKTSVVQLLAAQCGVQLRVVNMSLDSDYCDLIGGYKPASIPSLIRPFGSEVMRLLEATMDAEKNRPLLENMNRYLNDEQYENYLRLVIRVGTTRANENNSPMEWSQLVVKAGRLAESIRTKRGFSAMPFAYTEGVVTESARLGHWLLVDEINLASAECLDAILQVLRADEVHPEFRLFACMNPSTDTGKKALSPNSRSMFTEFFVAEPTESDELLVIVRGYLPQASMAEAKSVAAFYREAREMFPHRFSLRTFCRALLYARDNPIGGVKSSVRRSALILFSSGLSGEERTGLSVLVGKHLGGASKGRSALNRLPLSDYIEVEGSAIRRGNALAEADPLYIRTPSVKAGLAFLASVVSARRFPILLEGETSTGKTSTILHLAKVTGNRVFRINNHEHTDVEEYIGGYCATPDGSLAFTEGVLLQAVRNGDWIILDELNLAPPPVLEVLNRLLDDNRELFVPEINVSLKAHASFQLFATQNPAGSYAGRKKLSRAFLNRFVIIRCEPPPMNELGKIVESRCQVAPSAAAVMVEVMAELKSRRALSGIFSSSSGLMTMRDLFRWANRVRHSDRDAGDWRGTVAEQGYFLLGSRCRNSHDEQMVVDVIEKCLKRKIDRVKLFAPDSPLMPREAREEADRNGIVLTPSMCRMVILCSEAWGCNEPILFVGGTGCGKTTTAHLMGELLSVNCHERMETSDFLGSLRPAGGGKFRWQDGIVVDAMKTGRKLLIDEISLAPDSVLERMNSLLEPTRALYLTGGGVDSHEVVAASGFQLVATMNPGNDHGKKELSKALRNRFTEVWCPTDNRSLDEVQTILARRLSKLGVMGGEQVQRVSELMVNFFHFYESTFGRYIRTTLTIRDVVACAEIFIACAQSGIPLTESAYHALSACLLDSLGVLPTRLTLPRQQVLAACNEEFARLDREFKLGGDSIISVAGEGEITCSDAGLMAGNFFVPRGELDTAPPHLFHFDAPTTKKNVFRVARALISKKPVMLEGSPGAGKSSLIVSLAAATGNKLVRLNLSEQTDLSDLFGSDVPCVGEDGAPIFEWRDGPVLKAIKEGSWVLLDEMNLASQSVLEGLNSCFDFRKAVHICDLNKTFHIDNPSKCRFFACQNPHGQGGDRRALPRSFLNRFTPIFIEELTDDDFAFILERNTCKLRMNLPVKEMVAVNSAVRALGLRQGGPFEFNLRDLQRWCDSSEELELAFAFELIYISRLRSIDDAAKVIRAYDEVFGKARCWAPSIPILSLSGNNLMIENNGGRIELPRGSARSRREQLLLMMSSQLPIAHKLLASIKQGFFTLLVGEHNCGKRSVVEFVAALLRRRLHSLRVSASTDSMELLGSYEQVVDDVAFEEQSQRLHGICAPLAGDGEAASAILEKLQICANLIELRSLIQQAQLIFPNSQELRALGGSATKSRMRFEWIASDFVKAYRDGDWIIIEDVNCCSSAVLDCLNSCLESDGRLVLPECSGVEFTTVEKHPEFRVFFTMDPRNGPLSRAMRNRAVEIYIDPDDAWSKEASDLSSLIFDKAHHLLPSGVDIIEALDHPSTTKALRTKALNSSVEKQTQLCAEMQVKQPTGRGDLKLAKRPQLARNVEETIVEYYRESWRAATADFANARLGDHLFAALTTGDFDFDDLDRLLTDCVDSLARERYQQLMRAKAVNPAWEDYSAALERLRFARPFLRQDEHEAYVGLLSSTVALNDGSQNLAGVLASTQVLLHQLSYILKVPTFTSDRLQSMADGIPWRSDESRDAFIALAALSEQASFQHTERLPIDLQGLLRLPMLALILNKFLSAYGSGGPGPVQFTIASYDGAEKWLNLFLSVLWTLNFAKDDVNSSVCASTDSLRSTFHLEVRPDGDVDASLVLFQLLQAMLPPKDFVDPVVQREIQLNFWRQRLQVIDGGRAVLDRFLQLAMGRRQGGESLARYRQHALITAIERERESAHEEVEKLSPTSEPALCYRPEDYKFPKLLCSLRNIVTSFADFAETTLGEDVATCMRAQWGTTTKRILSKFISQLDAFLSSLNSSVKQLEEEFSGYPDILLPYLAVFNSISTCLNATGQRALSKLRINELDSTLHFPKTLRCSFKTLIHEVDALEWMLGEAVPLPASLQLQVVRRLASHYRPGDGLPMHLRSWIMARWEEWYKQHSEKKAQLYVYKSRKDPSLEPEGDDEEELELRSYLPDYSEVDFDETASRDRGVNTNAGNTLVDYQLCELLQSIVAGASTSSELIYHPVMRVVDELGLYTVLQDEDSIELHHLIELCELKRLLGGRHLLSNATNVYNGCPAAEVERCVAGIRALELRVQHLREEFPENNVLDEVAIAVERFLSMPSNQPLMKLASLLEKLLTTADEWMKLADRAHSIREEMTALQTILVDWRKMEVLCWGGIIEQVEEDTRRVAILSSWPILELLPRALDDGEDAQRLILMLVEWIHNSTLADFEARLFVGRLMARLAIGYSSKLTAMLTAVVAHFNSFSAEIGSALKSAREGVDGELRSFILVVKYNDLNLWSVKQSTQKAHVQLHKILRRFKRDCAASASSILQERLLPVPSLPSSDDTGNEEVRPPVGGETLNKIAGVLAKMDRSLSKLLDAQPMVDLRSAAEELLSVLDSQVRYEGEDEEKGKQQGQALFKRQKLFFNLVRAAKKVGFNSRRGLQVDSEKLTLETLTAMGRCGEDAGDLVRWAVVARNVFLKRFASIKSPQQVHAQQQLSAEVLSHLKGNVEFGLHWSVNALGAMREHIFGYSNRFAELRDALSILVDNLQSGLRPNHTALLQVHQHISSNLGKMASVVQLLTRLVECCPDEIGQMDLPLAMELESFAGCQRLSNPLTRIKSGSAECALLKSHLSAAKESLDRMGVLCEKFKSSGKIGVYSVPDFTAFKPAIDEELSLMSASSLLPLVTYFPTQCRELGELTYACHDVLRLEMLPVDARRAEMPSLTSLLLFVQRAYEGVAELARKMDGAANQQGMDLAKQLIEAFVRLDVEAAWRKLFDYVHSMADGGCVAASVEDLRMACDVSNGLRLLMDAFSGWLSQFLAQFAAFFVRYEQVACHLLLHGFVNAIPKSAEEGTSEAGQATATGEAAGFGEGQGETDVTDDVENLEQVEGLKDDMERPQPEDGEEAGTGQLDEPIEMDDDFAATLQDIDDAGSEGDSNPDDEASEGIEERVDWDKGAVEQPDERKDLDPEVWEKPDDGDEKGVDDEVDASGKERTGETTAAQETGETIDESTAPEEDLPDESDLPSDVEMDEGDEQEETGSRCDDQMHTDERDEATYEPQLDGVDISDGASEGEDGDAEAKDAAVSKNADGSGQCDPRDKCGLDGGGVDDPSRDAQQGGDTTQENVDQDAIDEQHESTKRDVPFPGVDGAGATSERISKMRKTDSGRIEKRWAPQRQRLPESRNAQELDKPAVDAEAMEVDEGQEEEQSGEHTNPSYVHIDREELFADEDRHALRESTVEEALATRSLLAQLKHRPKCRDQTEEAREREQAGGNPMEGEESWSAAALESLEELSEKIVLAPTHITAEREDEEKMESLKETISRVAELPLEEQQKLELKWALLTDSVSLLASELTENLRAIIEPRVASRLEGDYRSGKRLNMRRLIPYIASDYRKDRIWLRRTKRDRRNYEICIAIDDSSSMKDEAMITEVTCQSLCLIERALRQLEVGRLSICKFGQDVKVLSDFSAHEPAAMGPCLLSEITFQQSKTDLPNMLRAMDRHFRETRGGSQLLGDQMLIVLGDARGALSHGRDQVREALARLSQARVTTLYIVMDNGAKSIVNDQVAEFVGGEVRLSPYMKQFPFPFYAIVRGVGALPATMSEAIRQWFEFISS